MVCRPETSQVKRNTFKILIDYLLTVLRPAQEYFTYTENFNRKTTFLYM
jgi:hypothetical protein